MSENKEVSEPAGDGFFRLAETDQRFDLRWRSGSLKYRDFKLLSEGGIAKLYSAFDENLRRTVVCRPAGGNYWWNHCGIIVGSLWDH